MKKFTKLFLLTLCSWFLFFWFSNAQEEWYHWEWEKPYDVSQMNSEENMEKCVVSCEVNLFWLFAQLNLIWIWMILWIMYIVLFSKLIKLWKEFKDTYKNGYLFYTPILNLYTMFKITIWKSRFYCLIVLICLFSYSLYINLNENRCCHHEPSWLDYTWIAVWILTIIILSVLISKLNSYSKEHSNKELTNK